MNHQLIKVKKVTMFYKENGKITLPTFKNLLPSFLQGFDNFLTQELRLFSPKMERVEFHVTLCGKHLIRRLNNQFRQIDHTTDVLSFPVHESLRGKRVKMNLNLSVLNLGDIFICKEIAQKQAQEVAVSYQQELVDLLGHAALHLCGFDHEISSSEEKIMFDWQELLLRKTVISVRRKGGKI